MHIVIVEDEPLIQHRIKRLTQDILCDHQPKINCFDDIDDAEVFLFENTIDLLLLDLNLMGRNGFDLLKAKLAEAFHTIIISAYEDKAIEAFEYGVLDFIAKPFERERLEQAFSRLLASSQRTYYGCRYLSVKKKGAVELISIGDIIYIQAEGHYSLLNFSSSEITAEKAITLQTSLHNKNIEKIMQILPECFMRVHRSYIVNMNKVQSLKIEEGSRYFLQLGRDKQVPIGRTKYKEVKEYLDHFNSTNKRNNASSLNEYKNN